MRIGHPILVLNSNFRLFALRSKRHRACALFSSICPVHIWLHVLRISCISNWNKMETPYNGPSAIMVKGKLDTGSEGGHTHNTLYLMVRLLGNWKWRRRRRRRKSTYWPAGFSNRKNLKIAHELALVGVIWTTNVWASRFLSHYSLSLTCKHVTWMGDKSGITSFLGAINNDGSDHDAAISDPLTHTLVRFNAHTAMGISVYTYMTKSYISWCFKSLRAKVLGSILKGTSQGV